MTDDELPPELLAGMTASQRAAALADDASLCVLAGAGSGKTRVLVARIARRVWDGTADPEHILACTFTRKAAGELRQRLGRLGVDEGVMAGTFHGIAFGLLRQWWADRGRRPPAVLDARRRLLTDLVAGGGGRSSSNVAAVDLEIGWAKARTITPDGYPDAARLAGRRTAMGAVMVADVYRRYEEDRRKRRLLDLDDLLLECSRALRMDQELASAVRWRYRHFFVDEFQDVNPAQFHLLRDLLGDRTDLFVVGDPNQAIYSWNGSDPGLLGQLPTLIPGTRVLRLDDNHRSSPQILGAATAVLAEVSGVPAAATRPDGPAPLVLAHASDLDEAEDVADRLRQAHQPGRKWSHLAVLARTNAQLTVVAEALRRTGVPFALGGDQGLLGVVEVRQVLDQAAREQRERPSRPFRHVVVDLADQAREAAVQAAAGEREELAEGDGDEISGNRVGGEWAGGGIPRPGGDECADRGRSGGGQGHAGRPGEVAGPVPLATLAELAAEYERMDHSPTVEGFRSWLVATRAGEGGEGAGNERVVGSSGGHTWTRDDDRVALSTFHRAKGLQWPVVFVVGLEDGLVPIGYATTPEAVAEERRLLYVALTRAEVELTCSWARRRRHERGVSDREPSPWLLAVERACLAMNVTPDRAQALDRLAGIRASLAEQTGG